MNNNEKKYVEKVLNDYTEKGVTKVDVLKTLDKKAKRPALIFAYVFGCIGSLVLGLGMCMAMKIILADLMILGIVIGVVGIAMVSFNYYFYSKLFEKGKAKYANQIKELGNEILNK